METDPSAFVCETTQVLVLDEATRPVRGAVVSNNITFIDEQYVLQDSLLTLFLLLKATAGISARSPKQSSLPTKESEYCCAPPPSLLTVDGDAGAESAAWREADHQTQQGEGVPCLLCLRNFAVAERARRPLFVRTVSRHG